MSHHEAAKNMMDDYAKQLGDEGEAFKKDPVPVMFQIMYGMQRQLEAQQKQLDGLLGAVNTVLAKIGAELDKEFDLLEERITKLEIKTNH